MRRTFTLLHRYAGLVTALCRQLEERSLGARRVDLVCRRLDHRLEAVRIGLARPARDPERMLRLFRDLRQERQELILRIARELAN